MTFLSALLTIFFTSNSPCASPAGTKATTSDGMFWYSLFLLWVTPVWPCTSLLHTWLTPQPNGVTTPTPVHTTLRFLVCDTVKKRVLLKSFSCLKQNTVFFMTLSKLLPSLYNYNDLHQCTSMVISSSVKFF